MSGPSVRQRLDTLISALEAIEGIAKEYLHDDDLGPSSDLQMILRVLARRKVRDAMARCRIPDCVLVAEPGELCWFHASPRDPDLDDEDLDRMADELEGLAKKSAERLARYRAQGEAQ